MPLTILDCMKPDRVGELLTDRYELVEIIGRGASGVVYRARQNAAGRDVAVKLLSTHEATISARFEMEARIIGRLKHPNTIRLYDCGRAADGTPYIVTELLTGRSVKDVLRGGPLSFERCIRIARQIAGSLAEAHEAKVVHRDIKPENVFLERINDDHDFVKVIDFGIAYDAEAVRLTRPGLLLGTPAYIAPEQAVGEEFDHRADIYGLGVLLYHMIDGAPPFARLSMLETVAMHLSRPPPKLWSEEDLSPDTAPAFEIEDIVLSMLAKSPNARPQSMGEISAALEGIERRIARLGSSRRVRRPRRATASSEIKERSAAPPSGGSHHPVTQIAIADLAPAADRWRKDRDERPTSALDTSINEHPFEEDLSPRAMKMVVELLAQSALARAGVVLVTVAIAISIAATLVFLMRPGH